MLAGLDTAGAAAGAGEEGAALDESEVLAAAAGFVAAVGASPLLASELFAA